MNWINTKDVVSLSKREVTQSAGFFGKQALTIWKIQFMIRGVSGIYSFDFESEEERDDVYQKWVKELEK